jgi:nicotinate-nucleotide adenylyltransferase
MKIGIFGGTFNPPHIGHLIVAEYARESAGLDKILFIPAYISPLKNSGEEINSQDRLAMTELAIQRNPHFELSDIELKRKGKSFTVDTIEYLRTQFRDAEFYLLIGMDNYYSLQEWKDSQNLLSTINIFVLNRPGVSNSLNKKIDNKKIKFLQVPNIDISSTNLRKRIKTGNSVRYNIPESVLEYITAHKLYR